MKQFTDIEIIQEIKRGNSDEVLLFLYQTTQYKLTSYILKNNGTEDEAQDIFQDAVLSFYQYVLGGSFKDGASVDAFVFSVGRNKWINRAKQMNKMVSGVEEDDMGSVEQEDFQISFTEDKTEKMNALLTRLGERCKELLTYSIFYSMQMTDIAEKMEFSNADTAKTKNYKCKKRLMKIIDEDENVKTWLYQ